MKDIGVADPGDAPAGDVLLTPENTRIQFVGTHVGDEPDPRTGFFEAFTGSIQLDAQSGAPTRIQVAIQTESLTTPVANLTNHLKSPDFLSVSEYPQMTFASSKIEPAGEGSFLVTGDLTLLGQTGEIQFPIQVRQNDGFRLSSEFRIARSQFGMNFGLDRVNDEVALTVTVHGSTGDDQP